MSHLDGMCIRSHLPKENQVAIIICDPNKQEDNKKDKSILGI